ncbi:MAG: hypothetical protein AB1601_13310 [Planctomycetota bacterium]
MNCACARRAGATAACLLLALALGAVRAAAQPPATRPADEDRVVALEAALEMQRERLAALQQQVAAVHQASEEIRADVLKEQIRAVLADSDFRAGLTPSALQAGYHRGFFIRSSDDRFSLRFNARIQFRWTHYGVGSRRPNGLRGARRSDRTGFDVSRAYYTFSGHAYDKNLTYAVIFDGSEYVGYDFGILHMWVNYRFVDEFQITAGMLRVSGTRANADTATMQLVETPIMEEAYTFHRGLGARLWGKLRSGEAVEGQYRLDILNSLGTPNTRSLVVDEELFARGHDNNPALVFRTIWSLLGRHCQHPEEQLDYASATCDLAYHTEPALNIGGHYAFKEDEHDGTLRIPVARRGLFQDGGFALASSERLQLHQFGADAGFLFRGFSATFEYVLRLIDVRQAAGPPPAPLFQLSGEDSTTAQHAAYVQCGYFLPIPGLERKIELAGRVGWMHVATGGADTAWEYAGGLNYYISGHRVKLQTDVTRTTEAPFAFSTNSLANVNDDALIWRVQLQVAF